MSNEYGNLIAKKMLYLIATNRNNLTTSFSARWVIAYLRHTKLYY